MQFPRKTLLIFIGILFVISLTGCMRKKQEKDLFSTIKQRGKLIVGVKYDAKPFGYIDEEEEIKGFDIDLCREIAERLLGDKSAVEFKQVTSSNRIFAITSGSVDFVAATMTITPKREQIIDFSNPYYIAGQAVMVPKKSGIKSISDLKNKRIIVSLGATSETNIRTMFPTSEILGFRTYTDAFSALRTGRGDALTTDDTIIYGFLMESPDFIMLKERLTSEPYGLGFKKSEKTYVLRETINNILTEMANDGTMARLEEKWLGKLETTQEEPIKKKNKILNYPTDDMPNINTGQKESNNETVIDPDYV